MTDHPPSTHRAVYDALDDILIVHPHGSDDRSLQTQVGPARPVDAVLQTHGWHRTGDWERHGEWRLIADVERGESARLSG